MILQSASFTMELFWGSSLLLRFGKREVYIQKSDAFPFFFFDSQIERPDDKEYWGLGLYLIVSRIRDRAKWELE